MNSCAALGLNSNMGLFFSLTGSKSGTNKFHDVSQIYLTFWFLNGGYFEFGWSQISDKRVP